MKISVQRKNRIRSLCEALALVLLSVGIIALISRAFVRVGNDASGHGQELLEDSIRRAVVSCYATEGVYPPTLDYLSENYAIVIDEERYCVYYEIFADNIMPEITVVPLSGSSD